MGPGLIAATLAMFHLVKRATRVVVSWIAASAGGLFVVTRAILGRRVMARTMLRTTRQNNGAATLSRVIVLPVITTIRDAMSPWLVPRTRPVCVAIAT